MKESSKQAWLSVGFALIRAEGDGGLTLERACALAKKTKGSFYHHFTDMEAYRRALLETWERDLTQMPMVRVAHGSPEAQLKQLAAIVAQLDHVLDRAVRAWSLRDPLAQAAVRKVDQRRITFLKDIFVRMEIPNAGVFAQLDYAVFLGMQHLELSSKARLELETMFRAMAAALQMRKRKTGPKELRTDPSARLTTLR